MAETSLGVTDHGIWSDLDRELQLTIPAQTSRDRVSASLDEHRQVLVLAVDGAPRKVYPLRGPETMQLLGRTFQVRAGDKRELARLLDPARVRARPADAAGDADRDGIPDPLDILIGAKKTVRNAAAYTEGYIEIPYPMGDVPRAIGVCTDVVIRAVRNAGIDLQQQLHEDIARARTAYPMVSGRANRHIDHRRVKTLLPYFRRHWQARSPAVSDPQDPLRPGDVVFMDTFPNRSGPDHIGIISDTIGASGLPLVINNWTTGTVTAEMDLLTFVPVLHRYRLP